MERKGGRGTHGYLKEGCSRQRKNLGMFKELQRANVAGVSGREKGDRGGVEGLGRPGRPF